MHWLKKLIYILVASSLFSACADESLKRKVDSKKSFLIAIDSNDVDEIRNLYETLEMDSTFKQTYPCLKINAHLEMYFKSEPWKKTLLNHLEAIAKPTNTKENYSIWRNKSSLRRYFLYNYPPDTNIIVLEIFQ